MKKSIMAMIGLVSLLALGCESQNCSTCSDCPNGVSLESNLICEGDFNSAADYEAAIDLAESYGCSCSQ